MKKLSVLLCAIGLAFGLVSPAAADSLVFDINPSDSYINPQRLGDSGLATEWTWLEALLGFDVYYYGKEEDGDGTDGTWDDPFWAEGPYSTDWTYYILKYGVGQPSVEPDHWAIWDDGDHTVDLSISGLPDGRLSHITYFGTASVPEPATMLLLGSGLIGLAFLGRKKLFKK